jgi:catechol 2,3-dioxygenase-like lactoylglutathione lyase family enzyme
MDTTPPLGLGEVVLRVRDLDRMQRFYQDVFGLALLGRFERTAFLKIAAGRAGHTSIVALFEEGLIPGEDLAVSVYSLHIGCFGLWEAELRRRNV